MYFITGLKKSQVYDQPTCLYVYIYLHLVFFNKLSLSQLGGHLLRGQFKKFRDFTLKKAQLSSDKIIILYFQCNLPTELCMFVSVLAVEYHLEGHIVEDISVGRKQPHWVLQFFQSDDHGEILRASGTNGSRTVRDQKNMGDVSIPIIANLSTAKPLQQLD